MSAGEPQALMVSSVLTWWAGARAQRDHLPWRGATDPWEVLVSEVMLAQTQVARVAPRYLEVIGRFPTPQACASSTPGEVLRLWSGLGYNRRALALHACAQAVVARHAGTVPSTLGELVSLPGIGPYTARAVLAIAFGAPAAPIDTNVGRFLSRAVAGRGLGAAEAQRVGDGLVPHARPRDWAVASIDFGALICRARQPQCDTCPIALQCAWRRSPGTPDPAASSAHRARPQARFAGSDRELRGMLVALARNAALERSALARDQVLGRDRDRTDRVVRELVDEGLLVESDDGSLRLP